MIGFNHAWWNAPGAFREKFDGAEFIGRRIFSSARFLSARFGALTAAIGSSGFRTREASKLS
jgi:hypothetical protein